MAKKNNVAKFWYDVLIAAAQVTFGVIAATWFVAPFDWLKILVLLFNAILTIIFIALGYKYAKKI